MTDLLNRGDLDVADPRGKFFVDPLTFGFTHALDEDLLGSLNSVSPEIRQIEFLEDHRTKLRLMVDLSSGLEFNLKIRLVHFADDRLARHHRHAARLRVYLRLEIVAIAVAFAGSRHEGIGESLDDHITIDVLFTCDLTEGLNDVQVGVHFTPAKCDSEFDFNRCFGNRLTKHGALFSVVAFETDSFLVPVSQPPGLRPPVTEHDLQLPTLSTTKVAIRTQGPIETW